MANSDVLRCRELTDKRLTRARGVVDVNEVQAQDVLKLSVTIERLSVACMTVAMREPH